MLFVTVFLLPNLGKLSKFCHVFSIKRKFLKVVSCFQKEETHPNFVMLFPENENSQNCVMFHQSIIQILSCFFPEKGKFSKFCNFFSRKRKIIQILSCFFPEKGKFSKLCNVFPRKRTIIQIFSCFFPIKENYQNCVMCFSRKRTIIQIL